MATLIAALKDDNERVRGNAAIAIPKAEPVQNETILALIDAFNDDSHWVRWCATNAVTEIGAKAVPFLIEALSDESELVRENVARTLGNMGSVAVEAVPALLRLLKGANESIREHSILALGRIGPNKAGVPVLIRAGDDERPWIRRYVVNALTMVGKEAVPDLAESLRDESTFVRENAADVLCKIGRDAEQAIPILIGALSDESETVQRNAAAALGKFGPKSRDAVPSLIELLDGDLITRWLVMAVLRKIGKDAIPHLISALSDERECVRENASEALRKIQPWWRRWIRLKR